MLGLKRKREEIAEIPEGDLPSLGTFLVANRNIFQYLHPFIPTNDLVRLCATNSEIRALCTQTKVIRKRVKNELLAHLKRVGLPAEDALDNYDEPYLILTAISGLKLAVYPMADKSSTTRSMELYLVLYIDDIVDVHKFDFNIIHEIANRAPRPSQEVQIRGSDMDEPRVPLHEYAMSDDDLRFDGHPGWFAGDPGAIRIDFKLNSFREVAKYLTRLVLELGFGFLLYSPIWLEDASDESGWDGNSSDEVMDIECEMCGQPATRTCSGCYLEHYCSEACQQARRPKHVGDCYISEEDRVVTVDGPIDWIKRKWQNWRERRKARRMKKK
jgi:hypothetical protein